MRYYCGNNRCDSGETATTCPKDCKINSPIINNTPVIETDFQETTTIVEETQEQNSTDNKTLTENQEGLSRITGAVIGAEGNSGLLVIIIFLSILLVALIAARFMRNRKTITESI